MFLSLPLKTMGKCPPVRIKKQTNKHTNNYNRPRATGDGAFTEYVLKNVAFLSFSPCFLGKGER